MSDARETHDIATVDQYMELAEGDNTLGVYRLKKYTGKTFSEAQHGLYHEVKMICGEIHKVVKTRSGGAGLYDLVLEARSSNIIESIDRTVNLPPAPRVRSLVARVSAKSE